MSVFAIGPTAVNIHTACKVARDTCGGITVPFLATFLRADGSSGRERGARRGMCRAAARLTYAEHEYPLSGALYKDAFTYLIAYRVVTY